MSPPQNQPALLLHHDGELADVHGLLEQIGARFQEHHGPAGPSEASHAFDIVIATPRRILERRPGWNRSSCRLIAVLDGDSRTLRAQLRRVGVELAVRRPVHPAAMRLFLLHTLYRGPERRRRQRVSVGAPIRFRQRLRSRPATLTELSLTGARLLTQQASARGQRLKLRLGVEVTGGRPLRLAARVVRCGPAPDDRANHYVMAVRLDAPDRSTAQRLQQIIESHRSGPVTLPEPVAGESIARSLQAAVGAARAAAPGIPAQTAAAAEAEAEVEVEETDRRRGARYSYERRVVSLGDEATRVLLGRDISAGGMRIDPTSDLGLGTRLRLALHGPNRSEPLVVDARIERDDGEAGLLLRFGEIDADCARALDRLMRQLPVLETDEVDDEDEAGIVISEILERHTA